MNDRGEFQPIYDQLERVYGENWWEAISDGQLLIAALTVPPEELHKHDWARAVQSIEPPLHLNLIPGIQSARLMLPDAVQP